jgi:hypothetical protein
MYLRRTQRQKNGKEHSYWSIVESRRLADGRVVQRHGRCGRDLTGKAQSTRRH